MSKIDDALKAQHAQSVAAAQRRQTLEEKAKELDAMVKQRLVKIGTASWGSQKGIWNRPNGEYHAECFNWSVEEGRSSFGLPQYQIYKVELHLKPDRTFEFRAPGDPKGESTTQEGLDDLLERYFARGAHLHRGN